METRSAYSFIQIGLCLRMLMNVSESDISGIVKKHLDMLRKATEKAGLPVSVSGLKILKDVEEKLAAVDDDKPIGRAIAVGLENLVFAQEKIVYAEASIKRVYIIPERRFNVDYLLSSPEKIFRDGVYEKLSDIAQGDIAASFKCLVFGQATAAAFHVLRATEDVLKNYYFHHIKQNRLDPPMWGPMTQALKNKKRKKPAAVITDSLDLVRKSYRNPTQHPDAVYDIESAQDLIGVCVDVITKMAAEL